MKKKNSKSKYVPTYGYGGKGERSMAMGGVQGLVSQAPGVVEGIMKLLNNNPNAYSKQPIVNASAMRNMMNPYGYGGTIDDLSDDELSQLQQFAAENDMSEEDALNEINTQQGENNGEMYDGESFAMGGNADINVEGNEVVQTPGQEPVKMSGPSHEEGGINMQVPAGTKIFSDRLEIDGKSMQQRKMAREKRINKLNNVYEKHNPTNIGNNTMKRMSSHIQAEEAQDMQLQEAANKIYAPPQEGAKMAYGGYKPIKYPYGGYEDGMNMIPMSAMDRLSPSYGVDMNPNIVGKTLDKTTPSYGVISPASTNPLNSSPASNPIGGLGVGDYVGIAGTAFNTIAPILNTLRNKKMTAPVMNRFEGVGQRAIESNDQAQDYVAGQRANAMTNIDTSANASMIRNRNSARGVNTQRALDTITDIVRGKSRNEVGDTFSRQMIGLMGQRGALTNFQDVQQAQGQTQADAANAANRDNYYTNMAQNLTNAGEGIQSIGRNLNIARSNRVDANLISQLSQYGLEFDADGNLINKRR